MLGYKFPLSNSKSKGTDIVLPKNSSTEEPIYIIHALNIDDLKLYPKNKIIAKENATASIIEIYLSDDINNIDASCNAITDIILEKGANINHTFVQYSVSKSEQAAKSNIVQAEGSSYTGSAMTLGGKKNQVLFNIELKGEKAKCDFYVLALAHQDQKMDIDLTIKHQSPFTESKTLSRTVVKDSATASFIGNIKVPKEAIHTKASLENKNLLLSSYASANTRPQLEIDTHDIECTHGATVGSLDEEALFYLRSRGITKEAAKQLLIQSFIYPSLAGLSKEILPYIQELIHGY